MKSQINIAIAGLGFGSQVHIPAFKSIKGVKVLALADKDINKAKRIAKKHNIALVFDNIDDLFRQDIEAVSFALPPLYNQEACEKTLKKGLAVLSEKPLAVSVEKARELLKLAKNNITAVDFEFGELKVFKELKKIIENRKLGNVRSAQILWLVQSYNHQKRIWSWKTDALQGGGVINLLFSHSLYLIEWLFGPIKSLFADISYENIENFTPKGKKPAEDSLSFISKHPKGVSLTAFVSQSSPGGNRHYWEIVFDKGIVVIENYGHDYMADFSMKIKKRGEKELIFKEYRKKPDEGRFLPFCSLAKRFISGIKNNEKVRPDFRDGARVQELIEIIHQSAKNRKTIDL